MIKLKMCRKHILEGLFIYILTYLAGPLVSPIFFLYLSYLGTVDVILSYCHNSLNDSTLVDELPYFTEKGVGVISASPLSMGLLTKVGDSEPPFIMIC